MTWTPPDPSTHDPPIDRRNPHTANQADIPAVLDWLRTEYKGGTVKNLIITADDTGNSFRVDNDTRPYVLTPVIVPVDLGTQTAGKLVEMSEALADSAQMQMYLEQTIGIGRVATEAGLTGKPVGTYEIIATNERVNWSGTAVTVRGPMLATAAALATNTANITANTAATQTNAANLLPASAEAGPLLETGAYTFDPVVVQDVFDRSSGLGPFTADIGTWAVTTGLLQVTAMTGTREVASLTQWMSKDYIQIVVILPSNTNRSGAVVRFQNSTNMVLFAVGSDTTLNFGKLVNNTYTGWTTPTYTAGVASLTIGIQTDGDNVTGYLNGAPYGPYSLGGVLASGRSGAYSATTMTGSAGIGRVTRYTPPTSRKAYATKPYSIRGDGNNTYMAFPSAARMPDGRIAVMWVEGTTHTTGKNVMYAYLTADGKLGTAVTLYTSSTNEQDAWLDVLGGVVYVRSRQYDVATGKYDCFIASGTSLETLGARQLVTFDQFPQRTTDPYAAFYDKLMLSSDGAKIMTAVYGKKSGAVNYSVGFFQATLAAPQTWTLRGWIYNNASDVLSGQQLETATARLPHYGGPLIALTSSAWYGSIDDGVTWVSRGGNYNSGAAVSDTNPNVQCPRLAVVGDQLVAFYRYSRGHRMVVQPALTPSFKAGVLGAALFVNNTDAAAATIDGGYMDAIPTAGGLYVVEYNRLANETGTRLFGFKVQIGGI